MHKIIAALFIALTFSACNSNRVPKDAKIVPLAKTNNSKTNSYSVANFTLQISELWQEEAPSSNMRVTQFKITNHPEYQVVVSYFGNMENMVDENIERWKNQFSKEETYEELKLNIKNLTAIKIIGIYKQKPFPMAQDFVETPDYGTLAAIVPSNEGPYFLKLTAPKNIIEEQQSTFIEVLNSYTSK